MEQLTVNPANPTLETTASPKGSQTLGTSSVTLSDSADLEGGYHPTGTITFVLKDNGSQVYSSTVGVSGDGSYGSGSYTLPTTGTVAGSYVWTASYTGDGNNNIAGDDGTSTMEQLTVNPANPTLETTASPKGSQTLGTSSVTLSDSADLEGGYHPTGTITFVLKDNGSQVYSSTVGVSGDGSYGSGSYTLPTTGTVAGSYVWTASYTGDGNNNSAGDDGTSTMEQLTVNPANPTLETTATPKGSQTLGTSSVTLSDSADLEGGYHPTETITFVLNDNGSQVYSSTVGVSGDGSYGSGSYTLPTTGTVAGSYVWTASYT